MVQMVAKVYMYAVMLNQIMVAYLLCLVDVCA